VLDVAAPRVRKRAERQEQQHSADADRDDADDDDQTDETLKFGLHGGSTLPMTQHSRNLPESFEAAIFDFDETMVDLERQHTAASRRLSRAMGANYEEMPEEFRSASGKRVIDDIRDMREFFGWTRPADDLLAERQRYFDEEIERAHDLELMSGVAEVVRKLHARGIALGVASSAVRSSIEMILRRFDLLRYFTVIVDGSEVKRGKPDPAAYLVAAGRLGVDPASCIVFEDSAVGVRAAKAAGMFCIAVRNANALVFQDLTPADVIVGSFDELAIE
jgi:beta-phosphoglucomutase